MKKPVVVVTELEYRKGQEVFTSPSDLEIIPGPSAEEPLARLIREKKAFAVVLGVEKYGGPLYTSLPAQGVIARFGVGYDGIDRVKAKEHALSVINTPGVLEGAVAEQTLFLAGALLRNIAVLDKEMRAGKWTPKLGTELKGKIWAVIGLGAIGKQVSRIAALGFGVRVFGCDTQLPDLKKLERSCGIERASEDYFEIASAADVLSLHIPANKETHHYLNADRLRALKSSAILINTARGSLVDEDALYDVLAGGKLAGAALDVYENEPYRPVHPNIDLRTLPNVVLMPHTSSSTVEACKRVAERALQNIRYALAKEPQKMDLVF
jgi:lactate dehydrogenase-like 2-hydroxyacid dehydrogenase